MLSTLLAVEGFLASSKPGVPATSSRHAVATMSDADDLVWTPSSRGEPGKTPLYITNEKFFPKLNSLMFRQSSYHF